MSPSVYPLAMSLLGFGMGTMSSMGLPYVWYYVGVKSSFQHAREEFKSREPMCFSCLIFNLRVVIFALFYCLLDLSCGEYNVISLFVLCSSVNGSVCLCFACL